MKKNIFYLISLILVILLTACSAPTPAPTDTLEAAAEAIPTEAPTPEPTAEPTPSPTPDSMQEKFEMAPEVDGLVKEIQEKDGIEKVVYLYDADNPYDGVEGEYAGEFKKEVTMENWDTKELEEVGGVVLESNIIEYIMKDRISGFPEESGLDIIPIPLDISNLSVDNNIKISFEQFVAVGYEGSSNLLEIININFIDKVALINMSRGESKYIALTREDNSVGGIVNEFTLMPNWKKEARMKFTFPNGVETDGMVNFDLRTNIMAISGDFLESEVIKMGDGLKNFGDYLFDVTGHISLMSKWGMKADLRTNMLRYDGKYVFMKVNE